MQDHGHRPSPNERDKHETRSGASKTTKYNTGGYTRLNEIKNGITLRDQPPQREYI